jgi:hypothetical protein
MLRPLPLRHTLILIALLGVVLGAQLVAGRPAPELRIVVPAHKGDGALIMTPDGHTILIDGGADGATFAAWLGETLPLGRRRIDTVILTRPAAATLPGQIAAIRRYRIDRAIVSGEAGAAALESWRELLAGQNTAIHAAAPGDRVASGPCAIEVLHARGDRLAVAIGCGATTAYFLQSLDTAIESALLARPLDPATIVVYPWDRPTATRLMESLQPLAIVFSEGEGGRTGLTWHERRVADAVLLHESLHGQIELSGEGRQTRVRTARGDVHANR